MALNLLIPTLLRQARLFQVLFGAAFLFVTWSCLFQFKEPISTVENIDKVFHFIAYLGLAGLLERAYPKQFVAKGIIFLIVYGGIIEVLQGQTGYRSASWADLFADALGVLSYLLLLPLVKKLSQLPSCPTKACE